MSQTAPLPTSQLLLGALKDFQNDPIVWLPLSVFVVSLLLARRPKGTPRLSIGRRAVALWHLINGCFIYTLLDGLVGGFQRFPTLHAEYCALDGRYLLQDGMIMILSRVEIFVYLPLSVMAYVGMHRNSLHGDVAGIVVSTLAAYGTVIMSGGELFHILAGGTPHIPFDADLTFSDHHIRYFWMFYVGPAILWTVIPVLVIVGHWSNLVGKLEVSKKMKSR
eukprot:TRINITY_DN4203_c0_g1_i1.p1 TRINITY_DN4203_c0_g1~~TRINITY_DN4203_c0_g1_i1.p1  ORF type:complete len:221 (-),score=79.58 TRINITY_DN4203_c0_g1_i1:336-998(-)